MHLKIATLTNTFLNRWLYVVKLGTLSTALFMAFSGHYPPAFAQKAAYRIDTVPVITTEDAMQDDHISSINKHLQSTDDAVKAQTERLDRHQSEIDYLHGEETIIGSVLALLTAGGLFLQFRQRSA